MKSLLRVASILALFLSAVFLNGCASKDANPHSGFLGDQRFYESMSDHPQFEGVKVLRYSNAPLAGYDKFIVPPVRVYLSDKGRQRGVSEADLQELAQFFREQIIRALGRRHQVTALPGNGVAILRVAITDADPNIALMNLHPGSLIMGGGLGGASMEAEVTDSRNGKLLAAVMANSKGKKTQYLKGLTKWGHTKEVLEDWAKTIRRRIEEDNRGQG